MLLIVMRLECILKYFACGIGKHMVIFYFPLVRIWIYRFLWINVSEPWCASRVNVEHLLHLVKFAQVFINSYLFWFFLILSSLLVCVLIFLCSLITIKAKCLLWNRRLYLWTLDQLFALVVFTYISKGIFPDNYMSLA